MPKILVSDLFGTLIPDSIIGANYLYGDINAYKDINEICNDKDYHAYLMKKLCLQCANDLKKFLNNGNKLIIVSDLSSHELNLTFIYEEIIEKILKYCNKNFTLYMVTKGGAASFDQEKLKSHITEEYNEYGIHHIIFDGYKIGLLDQKKDIFKVIKEKFNLEEYELYSVGNDYADIPMLVSCMELGGKSSLLNYNLYFNECLLKTTLEDEIHDKIYKESLILGEKEILKHYPNFSQLDDDKIFEIKKKYIYLGKRRTTSEYDQWYKNTKEKLYQDVREGKLSLDDLIKENIMFDLCQIALNHNLQKKTFIENNLDEIDMYSTFRDYYNKVLSIDSKKEDKKKAPVKSLKP